jgi:hypothetical protein
LTGSSEQATILRVEQLDRQPGAEQEPNGSSCLEQQESNWLEQQESRLNEDWNCFSG